MRGDQRLPGRGLFIVRIQAHHPDDEIHRFEKRPGPGRVVGEELGFLVGQNAGVGSESCEFRSVKFLADRKAAQRVTFRAAGLADFEIPKFLPLHRKHKSNELLRNGPVWRAPEKTDRVDADRRAARRGEILQTRRRISDFDGFALEPSEKINAHAGCGIAERNIHRNFSGGVREIAGVRGGGLDDFQPALPTNSKNSRIFRGGFADKVLHLLLDHHFKRFGSRPALRRIRQRHLLEKPGVCEIAPRSRQVLHIKPAERIAVVANPE